ncbi:metallophosphoesterase family protein [Sutcliffiella halmapala]|uniref:metallophosphoesterase family protein n=1 Tax=Sutcliffiella halmapala TaxID=79882 RepID=UPI000994EF9E|nr:DNA repair exonuclease [Sutcliffiella halmapala]
MNSIRFIHAADLHLDSPFKGLNYLPHEIFQQVRASTFIALTNLVDVAIKKEVDFLLLAGDLFDLEQRSLLAQAKLREEFLRLEKANIAVYVIHGNHDFLTKGHESFRYPKNVHIFGENVEVKPFVKNGIHLANIYGFSYYQRHILQNKTSEYQKRDQVPFHIGLLHGNLSGREEHDPYAPFTLSELLEKDFHYWALGHIHKKEILCSKPPIVYPGNIQGRNKKETEEKGCYLVELSHREATLSFVETASIIWRNIDLSIESLQTMDELIQAIKDIIEETRKTFKKSLIQLTLSGSGPLYSHLLDESQLEDMLLYLNSGEADSISFQYVYSFANKTTPDYSKAVLKEKSFYQDFYQVVDQTDNIDVFLSSLFKHSEARHFLEPFNQEEKKAILEEAEQWLVTKFLEGEKG